MPPSLWSWLMRHVPFIARSEEPLQDERSPYTPPTSHVMTVAPSYLEALRRRAEERQEHRGHHGGSPLGRRSPLNPSRSPHVDRAHRARHHPYPVILPRMEFTLEYLEACRLEYEEKEIQAGRTPYALRIFKPRGEPGRPKWGGYTLDMELRERGWDDESLGSLMRKVKSLARERLDISVSYQRQDRQAIRDICDEITKDLPALANYEDCWPVRSQLKLFLKYTSEASRRRRATQQAVVAAAPGGN